jgi:hypothetical protein
MRYAAESASCSIVFIPSFMTISSGIQVISKLLLNNFRGCSVGIPDGFVKKTVETASGGMIYIQSFMTTGSGVQVILRLLPQQYRKLQCWYY